VARRRRLLVLGVGLFLLTVGVLANSGPLHSLMDAKGRLDKATAAVAELAAEKAELQAEMGRLSEADYLESLARQDLSYTRPGEELIILTERDDGGASAFGSNSGGTGGDSGLGLLERVLAPLIDAQ
jgi:cell division protein FtsB